MSVSTNSVPGARRAAHRAFREFYYELRTTEESPARTAVAVFTGMVIGCLPIYGLHLACCVLAARTLNVSVTKTYLAAHINNPITAPFIVMASVVLGRLVLAGERSTTEAADLTRSVLHLGRDVLVGAVVLGVVLGLVAAVVALLVGRRWSAKPGRIDLRRRVAQRFLGSGISHWEFVRGKLRYDPLYFDLLESGLLADRGLIVDLGCGRGILLALLAEVDGRHQEARRKLIGFESDLRSAMVARRALRDEAAVCIGDLESTLVPDADTILLIDVLHYLPRGVQESLLRSASAALSSGGRIIIREADRGASWRFQAVRVAERTRAWFRGRFDQRFEYRSAAELVETLAGLSLDAERMPMGRGTPFANALIVGRRGRESNR